MVHLQHAFSVFLIVSGKMLVVSEAFVASPAPKRHASSLNLVPSQGNQLVAAFNAANCRDEDDGDEPRNMNLSAVAEEVNGTTSRVSATSAARTFVSRVFHLSTPQAKAAKQNEKEPAPAPKQEWLHFQFPGHMFSLKDDDEVLYPIVGFRFVQGDKLYVLPTSSQAACSIAFRKNCNEELYGWFSPSCRLNMFSEDPCEEPKALP